MNRNQIEESELWYGKAIASLSEACDHDTAELDTGAIKEKVICRVQNEKKKQRQRKIIRVSSAVAACLVLGVGVHFAVPLLKGVFPQSQGNEEIDIILFPCPPEDMIWAAEPNPDIPNSDEAFAEWNGFSVASDLQSVLEAYRGTGKYLVIQIYKTGSEASDSFLYEGKTLGEWKKERNDTDDLVDKLTELQKLGEWLKYGELLYTEGVPEDDPVIGGEKWTKELYDETVARFGEELLARYIQSGEFNQTLLKSDLSQAEKERKTLNITLTQAYNAYTEQSASAWESLLQKQGLAALTVSGHLYLFATTEQLEAVKLDKKEEYQLSLGTRAVFEAAGWLDKINAPDTLSSDSTGLPIPSDDGAELPE